MDSRLHIAQGLCSAAQVRVFGLGERKLLLLTLPRPKQWCPASDNGFFEQVQDELKSARQAWFGLESLPHGTFQMLRLHHRHLAAVLPVQPIVDPLLSALW